jgi:DNA primase
MARYTSDSRDRVRDAVDFVELVSARTELRRAGPNRYEGLCPFHDERTPSFGINPVEKVYYCFGCQASGDLFTFVQETEGLDFKQALELLADRYNVELEREAEQPGEADKRRARERMLELLSRTADFYERYLWESEESRRAREYLRGRGLGEEILRAFRVGYSPSTWDRLLRGSKRSGFSAVELYATGLAQRSQQSGRLYDRFRARIMFPLSDIRGRVLGFGARTLGEGRGPKYLNSTDNEIYHKGLHLYGGHLARAHAARAGEVVLCEGYTDVLAMHQAGLRNAVGLMGTALTSEQLGELARMSSTVLLALDADGAGQEAMLRAAKLAEHRRVSLRVVDLPGGADPAELIQREGPDAMRAAIGRSVALVRFRVERILERGDASDPEGRDRIIEQLHPVFAELPPSAMRMELLRLVSDRLDLPEVLAEGLLSAGSHARSPTRSRSSHARSPAPSRSSARPGAPRSASPEPEARPTASALHVRRTEPERTFLALCIAAPARGAEALQTLEIPEHFTGELMRRAALHLRDGSLSEPLRGVDERDPELLSLLSELTVQAGREPTSAALLEAQLAQLQLSRLDRLIQAARSGGEGRLAELAERRRELKLAFDRAQERALERTGS